MVVFRVSQPFSICFTWTVIKNCVYITETAINIGYSCRLLTDEMEEVFVIDAEEFDEVKKQMEDAMKMVNDHKKVKKTGDDVDATVR